MEDVLAFIDSVKSHLVAEYSAVLSQDNTSNRKGARKTKFRAQINLKTARFGFLRKT